MQYLEQLITERRAGKKTGIYSCCSSNSFVIRAAMRRAKENRTAVLIEATANQVNQNGGYTGMTPADFYNYVLELARKEALPQAQLILGGDHLGPLTFAGLPEKEAMHEAEELVRQFVAAGFTKIHLDTSMRLADDHPEEPLPVATVARRSARLCKAAEKAFIERRKSNPNAAAPNYIVGSEVPIPGGTQIYETSVAVTDPKDLEEMLGTFRQIYRDEGLSDAWKRVVAAVVQPGVEFGDATVIQYDHDRAIDLLRTLRGHPEIVLEGHSTDYQPRECLRRMVEDGIAILKVGPALTFALREGLFALEHIEREMAFDQYSDFRRVTDEVMLKKPAYWSKYYHGGAEELRYARAYSLSDRMRYYLPDCTVQNAVETLLKNLSSRQIPMALLYQYLPRQASRVASGQLRPESEALLIDHIGDWIDDYLYATAQLIKQD